LSLTISTNGKKFFEAPPGNTTQSAGKSVSLDGNAPYQSVR
tara:strand:+ start:337 stop:459 length:123 start_codon:yes stop_codon:yes gene_type:complete